MSAFTVQPGFSFANAANVCCPPILWKNTRSPAQNIDG